MAEGYSKTDPRTGVPACPDNDLGPFGAGEGKSINKKGASDFAASSNADAALNDIAGLQGTERFSSIQSQGPVSIPSEGPSRL